MGVIAATASRLICILRAEHHELIGLNNTLRKETGPSASVTHGKGFRDVFGSQHQGRDRFEWTSEIVEVKASHDDVLACSGKNLSHLDESVVKELPSSTPITTVRSSTDLRSCAESRTGVASVLSREWLTTSPPNSVNQAQA